jgi:hypothetical protein
MAALHAGLTGCCESAGDPAVTAAGMVFAFTVASLIFSDLPMAALARERGALD